MFARSFLCIPVLAILLSSSSPATAAPLFFDDFNGENGGVGTLNYNGFAQWTVSSGTVDLIGNGFFDFFPGNGLYVDLDGSTGNAGLFSTNATFAPGTYVVSFLLAGSQRGDVNSVTVTLGDFTTTISNIPSAQPLTSYSFLATTTTTGSLSFQNAGGDNIGAILDNVAVSSPVPEPATLAVLGFGLAGLGAYVRRRKVALV